MPDLSSHYQFFFHIYNVDHILNINYACYLFPSPGLRPTKQSLELASNIWTQDFVYCFRKVTFSPKSCRGHVRTSGAVICPELFPLATRSIKTHVSSQRSGAVSEASPREPYFYFGASLSLQGAERGFGSFGSAGNPWPNFCFSKPHPFWKPVISCDVTVNKLCISRSNL